MLENIIKVIAAIATIQLVVIFWVMVDEGREISKRWEKRLDDAARYKIKHGHTYMNDDGHYLEVGKELDKRIRRVKRKDTKKAKKNEKAKKPLSKNNIFWRGLWRALAKERHLLDPYSK